MKKIAIMQPYFFPYCGYFKLIESIDAFVFFDDVQYTRRGWINRNRVKSLEKGWQYLTVPIKKAPLQTQINKIEIDNSKNWHNKHIKTLEDLYGKKPIIEMYKNITPSDHLSDFLIETIKKTCSLMGLKKKFLKSSEIKLTGYNQTNSSATNRILDICLSLEANTYINLPNGVKLYNRADFSKESIELEFISGTVDNYLSVLDYLK